MKHVRVSVTAGGREAEIHPMYGLLTGAPFVERATAMQWNFTGEALGILHYVEGDLDAFESAVADVDPVIDYDVEPAGEASFYAYVLDETTAPLREMFDPITYGGLVVVPPIRYRADGRVTMSIFGPAETIQAGMESIPSPIEVEIEEVGGLTGLLPGTGAFLSSRQREAIEAGIELGYYEVPREASQEDVARELECASSTAAEHLRKAEAKLARALTRR